MSVPYFLLVHPGETVAEIEPPAHGSQEWAFGYSYGEIENSRHTAGNSVLLDVEPEGAVEPVLITEDITLRIKVLHGKGYAVIHNIEESDENVRTVELNPDSDVLELKRGDAYYYLNTGSDHLILRDDATPAFQGHEEVQLTAPPKNDAPDGRAIELPTAFWRGFELLAEIEQPDSLTERIKKCPIHTWASTAGIEIGSGQRVNGVDSFLKFIKERTGMPASLEEPFHELLIIRGQHDPNISDEGAKAFGKAARELTLRYELTPLEAIWLRDVLFLPVQAQWAGFSRKS